MKRNSSVFSAAGAAFTANRFFAQIGQSVNKSVVEALIRDGAAKLKGLRSKKTGRRYDATLKMMCGEQGVPRFQMEFEREK